MNKINNSLFKFIKRKKINIAPTTHINSMQLFWKRFFTKKINIFSLILFLIILVIILIGLLFIKNSSIKPLSDSWYTNDLPSMYNKIIKRSFEKGEQLNFIRRMAEISKQNANLNGTKPIFEILYDSAFDSGGNLTTTTDIVTLYYNPYDLIKAINLYTDQKIHFNDLILGSNSRGIDIYSRIFISIAISLTIIITSIFINIFIGFSLGALFALNSHKWYAKIIDSISTIINSLPEIIWIFILCIFMGTKWWSILIIFSLISWTSFYEISKNEILELNKSDFIIALKSIGLNKFQISYYHLFKRVLPSHLILLTEKLNNGILIISSLVFLEFINESNNINIGVILKEAINSMQTNSLYLVVTSIIIIWFTISLKLFSNSLANTYNPKI